jgi:hypothetical protein
VRYVWNRARSVDAQDVGETIEAVARRYSGVCPTWALVDEARPVGHAMHRLFEWDDLVAAEAYRREQARHVVRELRVVVEDAAGDEHVQAYVHVVRLDDDSVVEGYRLTRLVVESADEYQQVLDEALSGLRAWERRYRHLSDLDEVFGVIRRVL